MSKEKQPAKSEDEPKVNKDIIFSVAFKTAKLARSYPDDVKDIKQPGKFVVFRDTDLALIMLQDGSAIAISETGFDVLEMDVKPKGEKSEEIKDVK